MSYERAVTNRWHKVADDQWQCVRWDVIRECAEWIIYSPWGDRCDGSPTFASAVNAMYYADNLRD